MNPAAMELARATLGGTFAGNGGRLVLAVLAIALGVALGFAVALINRAAVAEFVGGMRTLSGTADLEVRGPRSGFDESIFAAIARVPGVAVASPVVIVDARLAGRDDALRVYGSDALRAAAVTPAMVGTGGDALDLLRPNMMFVSPAAAAWLGTDRGDRIELQSGLREVTFEVAGSVAAAGGQRYAVVDIAAAQDAFDRVGVLSSIDIRARPGQDLADLRARIEQLLPAGVAVVTPQDNEAVAARMSRSYRVNLNVLSLVALFTGGLLVFSTQALSVARRRPQFALLRTLGLAQRKLVGWLLVEGLLIGGIGASIGLCVGYLLAVFALRLFGADLGAGFFRGVAPTTTFDPAAATVFGALGIVAALAGSALPAFDAARAVPGEALKAGALQAPPQRHWRAWPGFVALACALGLTGLPPIAGLPLPGYASIALLLLGTLLLLPRLFAFVLTRLPDPPAVTAQLAIAQLRASAHHATVSLATIVASVALMVSMAIMVASFRQSLDLWLQQVLPADVYVRAGSAGDSGTLSDETQRKLRGLPGIARIHFLRAQSILLDPTRPRVVLLARDLPEDDPAQVLPIIGPTRQPPPGGPPAAWISEPLAAIQDWAPGMVITLPLDGVRQPFFVAGIWRDFARTQGAVVIERATYARLSGDSGATDAAVVLEPGTSIARFREVLTDALPGAGHLDIATPGEIRTLSLGIFDRTFAVTYALEAAAVLIGLVGLSSSFGALVLARRREFGMLRHVGMTRRQIASMLALEGLVVSGIGIAVGLLLGWVMSLVLVHVINRQSFHWGMSVHMPWMGLVALAITLLALAMATTVASARAAMGPDVVRSVKDDW